MELTLISLLTKFLFGAAYTSGGVFVLLGAIWLLARRSGVAFLPTDTNVEETEGDREMVSTHEGGYPFSRIFGKRRQQKSQKE